MNRYVRELAPIARPILWTALITLIVTTALVSTVFAFVLRPTPLAVGPVNLNAIEDGEYIGFCQNKILFAVVKVTIGDHAVTDIEVIEHKESYREEAERIASAVVESQSLEVDAISGATYTSDTVLKAIEDALVPGV